MQYQKKRIQLLVASTLALAGNAYATNGINLIGYGTESSLMGGADTAVSRDTGALNTNPAGLAQVKTKLFDGYGILLRTTDLSHEDSRNDQHADNRYTPLAGGGYAQPLEGTACTAGVGFFTQGGAGAKFEHINTPFGSNDKMYSLFGIAKLSPGIACQVTDNLAIGSSVSMIYANIKQSFFFDTPPVFVGGQPVFAGFRNNGASALRLGFKLGMQYKLNDEWTIGASYTERTKLPLTDGESKFNLGPLGVVKYRDFSVRGLALPREVAVGAAFKATPDLLLSAKVHWINWDSAINDIVSKSSDPDNAFAPANVVAVDKQNWHNQMVYALGSAYTYDDKTTLYAGYNYGKNPMPEKSSNPLLAAILEHHVTLGFARQLDETWKVTTGIEYLVPVKVTYDSPIFGKDSQVRNEGVFFHMMFSKRW